MQTSKKMPAVVCRIYSFCLGLVGAAIAVLLVISLWYQSESTVSLFGAPRILCGAAIWIAERVGWFVVAVALLRPILWSGEKVDFGDIGVILYFICGYILALVLGDILVKGRGQPDYLLVWMTLIAGIFMLTYYRIRKRLEAK